MGLGGMKYAWQRQTKDLAHKKSDQYSSLILDNRGIGDSDKPLQRYSTSEMAKDVIEVLDEVGWTGKRELHIIGISMGGMIAQEMVCFILHSSLVFSHKAHLPVRARTPRVSPLFDHQAAFLQSPLRPDLCCYCLYVSSRAALGLEA
jgi:hypothetical protein